MLKKLSAVVLTLLLVMSCLGIAHAQVDEDILFRDAPWGITFTNAQGRFPNLYLVDFTTNYEHYYSALYDIPYGFEDERIKYDGDHLGLHATSFSCDLIVGGYNVDSVTMEFAYSTYEGKIMRSDNTSKLYNATYIFREIRDVDSAVNSLTEKLTYLYGTPDATGNNDYYTWNVWFGNNNTGVSIKSENKSDSNGNRFIWISYFTKDGDQWLESALEAVNNSIAEAEKKSAESNDTSGL